MGLSRSPARQKGVVGSVGARPHVQHCRLPLAANGPDLIACRRCRVQARTGDSSNGFYRWCRRGDLLSLSRTLLSPALYLCSPHNGVWALQYGDVWTASRRNHIADKLKPLTQYLRSHNKRTVSLVVVIRLPRHLFVPKFQRANILGDLANSLEVPKNAIWFLPLGDSAKETECAQFLWHKLHVHRINGKNAQQCGVMSAPS